ncbi:matrix remodeling-associated protein 8-like [Gymnodraco acuticeps]|uniref:Matrix remodeling-associated protein 8 n=1 Tax=Gymnodraco acuticeps TaxID=8218 RepID=A0A6P8U6L5_GYMAC|nr:matrix remodeling-associated protein 8-like [Gymnodraco acuticeps]
MHTSQSPDRLYLNTVDRMHLEMTLLQILSVLLLPGAWGQISSNTFGVVVEAKNITLPEGSKAVLPCHSPRMVWTQDKLKDRQRVVHWDLVRSSPEYSVERVLDMSPGARERVYNSVNKGRISLPDTAFTDGNFSLIIDNVVATDKGVYTCNLHHHYCQIHQSIKIQLNVTKSARKEKRYWDGERTVFVVMLGKSVVLPCVNRRSLWREGLQEDQQQVAHWDFQPPGVRPDRADRLVDLYASGERRDYGPRFGASKMSVEEDAFTLGDFSLSIADLRPVFKGLYSCHLHHHYCGLHERRIYRLNVGPAVPPAPTTAPRVFQNDVPEQRTVQEVEGPRVVNVILPEQRGYFVQHMGYFLATFLLLAFIVVAVIVVTRRRKKRGLEYDIRRYERGTVISGGEMSLECTELRTCNQEPTNSDYKNNILKERDMSKDCNMDFDGKLWK